jgi:hypothetical protein
MAGWAWFLTEGRAVWVLAWNGREHRVVAPVPLGVRSLVLDSTPRHDGGFDLVLRADDAEVGRAVLPVPFPAAIASDGAFLTVGWSRPFPVCDDYAPPAPAPSTFERLEVTVGPPPPFDFAAELTRVMRHQ